jgi:hypothetical protein
MTDVTGTLVRDLLLCEPRAGLDVHGDGSKRDEVTLFVRMRWNGGMAHEDAVVPALPDRIMDLRDRPAASRAENSACAVLARARALCQGRSVCRAELEEARDVTLVAGLGPPIGEVVDTVTPVMDALAATHLNSVRGEHTPGLGRGRPGRFHDRAPLLGSPGATAFARAPLVPFFTDATRPAAAGISR